LNKAQFITLIENPGNLDKSHITALKNIVADFPFFQAGHMLLTKALFNEHHYEYEKHLKSTALVVSDRELLYRFLHNIGEPAPVMDMPVPESVILDAVIDIRDGPEEEWADFSSFVPETVESVADVENKEHMIIVPEIIETFTGVEDVEQLAIVTEEVEDVVSDEPVLTEKLASTIAPGEEHSFTEWLTLSVPLPPAHTPEPDEKKEPTPEAPVLLLVNETTEAPLKSNIPEFESLLDKFIRDNPSISRPKAEFYNPANIARQSVEEDDDLVTETLAGIYYKQGAYKKAIRAYEKLCLIYPHKMSYFASLIQKIKDENKSE
jgi:hypothetical protein